MSNRDEYIAKMKLQLDELNAAMDKLEASARDAKKDVRATYKVEMSKLRQQWQQATDKLEELKTAGEGSWKDMAAGVEKVRDAVIHSFHYFKSQL